jgi:hypothetical protein
MDVIKMVRRERYRTMKDIIMTARRPRLETMIESWKGLMEGGMRKKEVL